jgi:hypothetical protein
MTVVFRQTHGSLLTEGYLNFPQVPGIASRLASVQFLIFVIRAGTIRCLSNMLLRCQFLNFTYCSLDEKKYFELSTCDLGAGLFHFSVRHFTAYVC